MHDAIAPNDANNSYWRKLLHRWLVEYNPLYLLSAMLVLGGMIVLSRGLAAEGSLYGEVGVAAIAELYALALIGGSALLTRIGQRRSGVMLALLTALYQCDLTLHTETCPNLGSIGAIAAGGWLLLFIVKLFALGWAVRVRFSRGAIATAVLGAAGLTLLPHVLHGLTSQTSGGIVAVWLSAIACAQRFSSVESRVELDAWGHTVLRRAVGATWGLWAVLLTAHVMFWTTSYSLKPDTILCIAPVLLLTRFVRGELRMWSVVIATLLFVALKVPATFSACAFVTMSVLVLRAIKPLPSTSKREEESESANANPHAPSPYRMGGVGEGEFPIPTAVVAPSFSLPKIEVIALDLAAQTRLFTGALFALYASIWTLHWDGGSWPAHILALDLCLVAVIAVAAWRKRARLVFAPLTLTLVHFAAEAHLIPQPHSALSWGASAIGVGFAILIASVAASYWLGRSRSKPISVNAENR